VHVSRFALSIAYIQKKFHQLFVLSSKAARSSISLSLNSIIAAATTILTPVAHIYFGRYCHCWQSHVFVVVVVFVARRTGLSNMTCLH
jgi:hypothetical protein